MGNIDFHARTPVWNMLTLRFSERFLEPFYEIIMNDDDPRFSFLCIKNLHFIIVIW